MNRNLKSESRRGVGRGKRVRETDVIRESGKDENFERHGEESTEVTDRIGSEKPVSDDKCPLEENTRETIARPK